MLPTDRDTPAERTAALLMTRLDAMRRRARVLLLLNGTAVLLSCSLTALLLLVALDWLFHFPGWLRFALGLAWLCLPAWLIARRLWPILPPRFGPLHLAYRIEEQFPQFEDRLSSTVSFLTQQRQVQDPLRLELIRRTARLAEGLPLEQVITARPTWRACLTAILLLAAVGLMASWQPLWAATGGQRLLYPFLPYAWPRTVHICSLTGDLTVAKGDSVVLAMEVIKGQGEALRGVVHIRQRGQPTEQRAMRREGLNRYTLNLDAVTGNVHYWFTAGDDSTQNRPGRVQVVNRPRVTNLQLAVAPPEYVGSRPAAALAAGQNEPEIIEGSRLIVSFQSSKPLGRGPDGNPLAGIASESGLRIPAQSAAEGDERYRVEVIPSQDTRYAIQVTDEQGFENEPQDIVAVVVRPDKPPLVSMSAPVETLAMTPRATVQIAGLAVDDLGINRVDFAGLVHPSAREFSAPLAGWTTKLDRDGLTVAQLAHTWTLADTELQVGDTVEYCLVAQDNRNWGALVPQSGRSAKRLLRVISETDFAAMVTRELHHQADRLKRVLQQEEELIEDTAQLRDDIQQDPGKDPERQLLALSTQQRDQAESIAAIGDAVRRLAQQLAMNGIEFGREKQQSEMVAEQLAVVVEPAMERATEDLTEARAQRRGEARIERVASALQGQRDAAQAIRRVLNKLQAWDDHNSAVANLQDLIDLQQKVSGQTAWIEGQALGRRLQDLPPDIHEALVDNAQQQAAVTTGIETALEELQRMQDKLRKSRPADARALSETAAKLRSDELVEHSRRAGQAIRENRTAQAQADQNAVERALSDAINQLSNRRQRELAELSKRLARVEDALNHLLQQQQELAAETAELIPELAAITLADLAGRQRQVRNNTGQLADDLVDIPEAQAATPHIRRAATQMTGATEALYRADVPVTLESQEQAIAELQQALQRIEETRRENEAAIRKEQLLAAKRLLIDIRKQQNGVNQATEKIVQAVAQANRLTRIHTRRARKQARAQSGVKSRLAEAYGRFSQTPVYLWVLTRVLQAMESSESMLADSQLTTNLTRVQHRAVRLLDQLISAIQKAESMVEEQFADGGGSGGAGGKQQGSTRPVPTVAELLVLQGMQEDILLRTQDLANDLQPADPTEQQLEQMVELGEDQRQLQTLTKQLTDNARQQDGGGQLPE